MSERELFVVEWRPKEEPKMAWTPTSGERSHESAVSRLIWMEHNWDINEHRIVRYVPVRP